MPDYNMCRKCGLQWAAELGIGCPKCGPRVETFHCSECCGNDENPRGHCSDCTVVVDRLRDLLYAVQKTRTSPVSSMKIALKIADEIEDLISPGTSASEKEKRKAPKKKKGDNGTG